MTSLAPYDAVLVASYEGPRWAGRRPAVPAQRDGRPRHPGRAGFAEVGAHYALFGGVSPINDRNAELVEALAAELAARGVRLPVVVGNRNWRPYVADALVELADGGAKRVLAVFPSAYGSSSGCRQYREDIERALAPPAWTSSSTPSRPTPSRRAATPTPRRSVSMGGCRGWRPGAVRDALDPARHGRGVRAGPEGLRYAATHRRVAGEVARLAGFDGDWELVFCSRSGPPRVPWLAPDVNDRIRELAASGVIGDIVAPIGFVNDHMEVVYGLDTEAAATASGSACGSSGPRRRTSGRRAVQRPGGRPRRPRSADAREASDPEGRCGDGCCGTGRPRT